MASMKFPTGTGPMKVQCFYNFNPLTPPSNSGQEIPAGFSETYWIQANLQSATVGQVTTLVNARMATFATDISLVAVRITDTGILRKPLILQPTDTGSGLSGVGTFSYSGQGGPTQSLHPQLAMLHRLTASDNSYNLRFYHCPPSKVYLQEEQVNPADTAWGPLYTAWLNALKGTQIVYKLNGNPTSATISKDPQLVGLRSRKVGRPFGLFRGSRPIR